MKKLLVIAILCATGALLAQRTATFKVGNMEVIAMQDMERSIPNEAFLGAPPEELSAAVPSGVSQTSVNCYVVRTDKHTYLIDSGGSTRRLMANLKLAGVTPEEIDAILITHMHDDHIGGLLIEAKAAFPKATLHISREEYNFWRRTNPNVKHLGWAYLKRIELFEYGDDLPIVRVEQTDLEKTIALIRGKPAAKVIEMTDDTFQGLSSSGHTPGHTVYENKQLMMIGALVHVEALQFADPCISLNIDIDMTKATASRKQIFERAATTNKVVLGAHLPFPGIGHIVKDEADRFSFVPLDDNK